MYNSMFSYKLLGYSKYSVNLVYDHWQEIGSRFYVHIVTPDPHDPRGYSIHFREMSFCVFRPCSQVACSKCLGSD